MMDQALNQKLFTRAVFEGVQSEEAKLVLAEKIWPAVGAALEALLSKEGQVQDARKFLAQYLMRHKTQGPKEWRDWAEFERGKRLVEKLKDGSKKVFDGFTIKRVIRSSDMSLVVDSIDESFMLHKALSTSFQENSVGAVKAELTFEDFWPLLTERVRLRGGVIQQGLDAKLKQQRDREQAEEEKRQEEKEKLRKAQEVAEQTKKFSDLLHTIQENIHLTDVKVNNHILTGSAHLVQGYELPVEGDHVQLLASALHQLGFRKTKPSEGDDRKWSLALSRQWAVVQRTLGCSQADGVVDGESLTAFLEAGAVGYLPLRKRVRDEWDASGESEAQLIDLYFEGGKKEDTAKPSLEELSESTGMSLIRVHWLHDQFKALLPDGTDEYPENPAALSREEMHALTLELQPDMSEEEFSQKFFAIDGDGSGQIEFDEFIEWMCLEKIDIN